MRPENAEFKKLFELSGWSQTKAAKRFHCSQPVISRWLHDVDPADKTAVELFKIILSREQPDKISPVAVREEFISKDERKRERENMTNVACPICQSENITLIGDVPKCLDCGNYFQASSETESRTINEDGNGDKHWWLETIAVLFEISAGVSLVVAMFACFLGFIAHIGTDPATPFLLTAAISIGCGLVLFLIAQVVHIRLRLEK